MSSESNRIVPHLPPHSLTCRDATIACASVGGFFGTLMGLASGKLFHADLYYPKRKLRWTVGGGLVGAAMLAMYARQQVNCKLFEEPAE
jgi:hypothetical protein